MALVLKDRVKETTTTTGTGTVTLAGAVSGFQSFSAIGNANTTYYAIIGDTEWEIGIGTYTSSGTTLSRDTVLASSNSGSLVSFSAGTKTVFCDYPATKSVSTDSLASPPAIGATSPSTGTFTTLTAQTEVLKGTGQNFLLYSQNFTNAVWQTANATATNNTTIAPDGTTTAGTVTLTVSSVGFFKQNFNVTAGQVYTFSFYALRGTATDLKYSVYNNTGSADIVAPTSYYSSTNASTWSRISVTFTAPSGCTYVAIYPSRDSASTGTFFIWGAQVELAQTAGVYLPTTTTAVYGTPTISLSGVAGLGLQSDGSLYVSPAGTGALQAQATTSTATGGNARGANAVDWQTSRGTAAQIASSTYSTISGGYGHTASGYASTVSGGYGNTASNTDSGVFSGGSNVASGYISAVVGGQSNTSAGYYNFVGAGFTNSGTSGSAVTTQSGTMNATTAVTLSGSNASIKVGQYITGTSIAGDTYVAAISGTSLTLSKNASGSSTSTLSFYTPHGIVVGGGNNQATGSYSFIGGGGDAGTAGNRNVASGAWSTVVGGIKNTASGVGSFVGGGGTDGTSIFANLASGINSLIAGGWNNQATGGYSVATGGQTNISSNSFSFVGGGSNNSANSVFSAIMGGYQGTTRSIDGNHVFPACNIPISLTQGVSQAGLLVLGVQTTDATATVLRSNSSAASSTNQVILPNNSAYYFRGEVVAGVTGGGNTKGWYVEGVIKRGAGVGTTALVGTPTVTSNYADAGASTWALTATADTTNGGLAITFTGQASTTIRCVAKISTVEMTY
jgi:hypothetical protein